MTQGLLIGIMRSVRTEPAASNGRTHGSGREGGESLRGHGLGRVHRARRWPWVCHHLYRCLEARRRLLALLASLELRRLLFAQLSVAAWKTDSQLGGSLVDVHRAQPRPPRRHHLLEVAVAEKVVQRPTVRRVHLSGGVLAQVALEDGDLLRHAGLGGAPEERGGEGVRVRRVRGGCSLEAGGAAA